jgi:hypothetical protein
VSSRALRAGAGLAVLYVVVALVTGALTSRRILPLFDGFVPPTPYAWVNPPPSRAGDNVVPKPVERQFTLGPDGVPASNASTDDGQAIVGLDKGSVAAHAPDSSVSVHIVPVDPGTLGPLPAGMRVVSNAYKVELNLLPSQTPLTTLPVKGTIALTAAEAGDRMLFSADGQTWQEKKFSPYGQDNGLFTDLDAVGWFVIATTAGQGAAAGGGNGLRVVLLVLAGIVPVLGAALALRLPSPVPAASADRGTRSRPRRPPGKRSNPRR